VKKIVLRTNAPGHSEFNAYSKCNFRLNLQPPPPDPLPPDDSDRLGVRSATDSASQSGSGKAHMMSHDLSVLPPLTPLSLNPQNFSHGRLESVPLVPSLGWRLLWDAGLVA